MEEMGWTEGGLAGPQLLYLKCQDQDARIDRVTATAEPSSGSLWRIFHEGCPSVRYIIIPITANTHIHYNNHYAYLSLKSLCYYC